MSPRDKIGGRIAKFMGNPTIVPFNLVRKFHNTLPPKSGSADTLPGVMSNRHSIRFCPLKGEIRHRLAIRGQAHTGLPTAGSKQAQG